MTALDRQVLNFNQLSQLNFRMNIARSVGVGFFCVKINVPGLYLPTAAHPTPFVNMPEHGDQATFNPLIVTFKVDEDLHNYYEIHNWMRSLAATDEFTSYRKLKEANQYAGKGIKSDILVQILNSSRRANYEFNFIDCVPIELSDMVFNSQDQNIQTITASVVFQYLVYDYAFIPSPAETSPSDTP